MPLYWKRNLLRVICGVFNWSDNGLLKIPFRNVYGSYILFMVRIDSLNRKDLRFDLPTM